VLVVDDNDDARLGLCRLLRSMGYQVISAADGLTALAMAHAAKPQLVLIDIGLPEMDGYELARHLRRVHGMEMRLVAITGYGQQSDRARAFAAGFDEHLIKPVGIESLMPHLRAPA
jgi:CheY-like chemotaxis protein